MAKKKAGLESARCIQVNHGASRALGPVHFTLKCATCGGPFAGLTIDMHPAGIRPIFF